jgi:WS/DGAT/MGAT family acyltransferase
MPEPEPSGTALIAEAISDALRRPTALVDTARLGVKDARALAHRFGSGAAGVVTTAASLVRHSSPGPLTASIGEQRRIAIARTRLDDYRRVRRAHGGTVNDVVLTTVTGALRGWLRSREHRLGAGATVRVLAPVSVADSGDVYDSRVTGLLVDLPVGEGDPLRRLAQVRAATASHLSSGRAVAADALVEFSGFAPPTLHALGARAAHSLTRRLFSVVVTNVPGPQVPLYAAGARMLEMYPIVPLNSRQPLSIGLTSYDGGVYYGLNGDRDAMPDLRLLAELIEQCLAELVSLSPDSEEPVSLTERSGGRPKRSRPRSPAGPRR